MAENLSSKARAAFEVALREAKRTGQRKVNTELILYGIISIRESAATEILEQLHVSISTLQKKLETHIRRASVHDIQQADMGWTTQSRLVRQQAIRRSAAAGSQTVGTHHILIGILAVAGCQAATILNQAGVTAIEVEKLISVLAPDTESLEDDFDSTGKKGEGATEAGIEYFCRNLTVLASEGDLDPVIGREHQIDRVMQVLCRRKKCNPILIGEPGVGKTAIVEGLASIIASGDTPDILSGKQILALDMAAVVAGTKYRGQFEKRLKKLLDEIKNSGDKILFIDEVHLLVGAGAAEGSMDAANLLKPILARGELQCIGATTLDEYRKKIEKDGALERRFQPVPIDPPNIEDTIKILEGLRGRYEKHHAAVYTDEAVKACVVQAARYISGRFMPDKAIDVMDEAGAKNRVQHSEIPEDVRVMMELLTDLEAQKREYVRDRDMSNILKTKNLIKQNKELLETVRSKWLEELENEPVTVKLVAEVVADMTGIPVSRVGRSETAKLLDLEKRLEERIVGQGHALAVISSAIRRSRVGLRDRDRPAGVFLFLGPSGVGKTETARVLAELVFGQASALIRIDMSEFQEGFSGSRLVGAPPGYVGYNEGGQLTEKVRRRPYSVVLLDEIEKAHADMYNMLLQVMDYGRMTDNYGREIDFRNTIIIMTSNIAARDIHEGSALGFSASSDSDAEKKRSDALMQEGVRENFNPEFINRLDEIVVFNPLEFEHILKIVDIQILEVQERLRELGITAILTEAAREFLTEQGFEPKAGARHLRRAIGKLVEDPLTDAILRGEFLSGDSIRIERDDERLLFTKTETEMETVPAPEEVNK